MKNHWWVCAVCKEPVARVKSGKVMEIIREHRKTCLSASGVPAGFWIKNLDKK